MLPIAEPGGSVAKECVHQAAIVDAANRADPELMRFMDAAREEGSMRGSRKSFRWSRLRRSQS